MTREEFDWFRQNRESLLSVRPNGEIMDMIIWDDDGTGTRLMEPGNDEELMATTGETQKKLIGALTVIVWEESNY